MSQARPAPQAAAVRIPPLSPLLVIGGLLMTLMIGARFEVGGDWFAYTSMFSWSQLASLDQVLARDDPAYFFVNWFAARVGADVWLVNTICGGFTVAGVIALARLQPLPWLAVLISIPYLVVVVAMGYTRQAAALGFVMIGLASLLTRRSILRYVIWVAVAAMFHKTAVIALPIIAFVFPRNRFVNLLLLSIAVVGLYFAFLEDHVDTLVRNYIGAGYSSGGAYIRLSMCVVPAIIFFAFRERLGFSEEEQRLWRNFSIVSLVGLAALLVSPSTTAVDRVALYLLPMQFVILSRLPGGPLETNTGKLLVIAYAGLVLWVWLNHATHAPYWLPYLFWFAAS